MSRGSLPQKKAEGKRRKHQLPMNKRELVEAFAEEVDCPVKDAEWIVDAVLEVMARPIIGGRGLRVTGLGSFRLTDVKPRMARNPQTGGVVPVKGSVAIRFKPAQRLMDLVNGRLKLKKGERIVTKKPKGSSGLAG